MGINGDLLNRFGRKDPYERAEPYPAEKPSDNHPFTDPVPRADNPRSAAGRTYADAGRSMPGVFTGATGSSADGRRAREDTFMPPSDPETSGVFTRRQGNRGGSGSFSPRMRRLPPLWGVDLVLILITALGVALIAANLQTVLLALARLVFALLRILFWLAVIAVIGMLIWGSHRRRRWR